VIKVGITEIMVSAHLGSSLAMTTGTREEMIGWITDQPKWRPLIRISMALAGASIRDLKGNISRGRRSHGATRMPAQRKYGQNILLR
jgi:hypothetical protein